MHARRNEDRDENQRYPQFEMARLDKLFRRERRERHRESRERQVRRSNMPGQVLWLPYHESAGKEPAGLFDLCQQPWRARMIIRPRPESDSRHSTGLAVVTRRPTGIDRRRRNNNSPVCGLEFRGVVEAECRAEHPEPVGMARARRALRGLAHRIKWKRSPAGDFRRLRMHDSCFRPLPRHRLR